MTGPGDQLQEPLDAPDLPGVHLLRHPAAGATIPEPAPVRRGTVLATGLEMLGVNWRSRRPTTESSLVHSCPDPVVYPRSTPDAESDGLRSPQTRRRHGGILDLDQKSALAKTRSDVEAMYQTLTAHLRGSASLLDRATDSPVP